ncbi:MarR family transcriptional regulator [Gordonia sp. CPCC 205515]|uniref:MarR family winged helix-turn-helix transcriptional regulator n=1 Tax=Gordonia sp. CPCC 205515 TaxID=3140791 RepID=UPI003AF38E92
MSQPDALDVASHLRITVGTLVRRLRQHRNADDPSVPETAVLARLDRCGPTTSAELARLEQVTPQSMGVTVAALQGRGFLERAADPSDGRRMLLSLTGAGADALTDRRNHRTRAIADAMSETLTDEEIGVVAAALPLLDRLGSAL